MSKICWNVFCICWKSNEKNNCSAEDIEPDFCRLSDINLKTMLDSVKEIYTKENETLKIEDILCGLKEIKENVKKKEAIFESNPITKKLDFYIEKLEKR